MLKENGKVQAKSWQPPTVQTASKGQFAARPFPEIAKNELELEASHDHDATTQPGAMIGNINRSLSLKSQPVASPVMGIERVQAKLTIGEPGDKYEQEADRVAAEVVQRINSPETPPISPPPRGDGEEKTIQRQPAMPIMQRVAADGEENPWRMAETKKDRKSELHQQVRRQATAATVPNLQADFETTLNRAKGGGTPLDNAFRAKVEPAMGADFSGVRVHTDAQADMLSRSIQAKAFTTGQEVFFRQGAYEPGSRGGQELIAHELTHVVQQNGGAVQRSGMAKKQEKSIAGIEKISVSRREGVVQAVNDFTYGGGKEVEKESIPNLGVLQEKIENVLEEKMDGAQVLFYVGERGRPTTVKDWGNFLRDLVREDYEVMNAIDTEEALTNIVKTIKAKNRSEILTRITEFYGILDKESVNRQWTEDGYKKCLLDKKVFLEKEDEQDISRIYNGGEKKRTDVDEEKQGFQIGELKVNMTEKELKQELNKLLGETVSWGHEITQCMGNTGKKGEMYYKELYKELVMVGTSSQSHASSKGGKTIIWEVAGEKIVILAIAEHTDTVPDKMNNPAASGRGIEIRTALIAHLGATSGIHFPDFSHISRSSLHLHAFRLYSQNIHHSKTLLPIIAVSPGGTV